MIKSTAAALTAMTVLTFAPRAIADDEGDVRGAIAAADHVFEARDASLARSIYAQDVIWQNPFGVRLHGEKALEAFLDNLFHRPGYLAGKEITKTVIYDVRLQSSDTATGWTLDTSEGQIDDATGKAIGMRKSHTLEVLKKRNGKWWIVDELIMDEKSR